MGLTFFFGYFFVSISLQVFQVDKEVLPLWILFTMPCTVFGSKLFTPLLAWKEFVKEPKKIWKKKWFSFFGGFAGLWFSCLVIVKYYNIPILQFSDALLLFLPLAHSFGRIACINHGCCSCKPKKKQEGLHFSYSDELSKAVKHYNLKGVKLCPVHLYEMGLNLLLVFISLYLFLTIESHGWISATYFFGYGIIRFALEPFRAEEEKILLGKYSLYQMVLTFTFFAFGIFYLFLMINFPMEMSVNFHQEYLINSLMLLPEIFIMALLSSLVFGLEKREKNGKTLQTPKDCLL